MILRFVIELEKIYVNVDVFLRIDYEINKEYFKLERRLVEVIIIVKNLIYF